MNQTFPNNVQVPATPYTFTDLLDLWKKNTFLSLFCHGIATVTKFDPVTQTASATMAYSKTFTQKQSNGTYTGISRPYSNLTSCPVIFLGGLSSYLTFPDVVGADCLVIFNDRDIDNWLVGDGAVLNSSRLHSFSDAILLVGLRSNAHAITNFDMDRIVLKKGNAVIGVGLNNELVKIANESYSAGSILIPLTAAVQTLTLASAGTTVLVTTLETLIAQFSLYPALTTFAAQLQALIVPPSPTVPSSEIISLIGPLISNTLTQIGGLLE